MVDTTHSPACPNSLQLQERGKMVIPGLTQLLSKRPDQFAPGAWPGYYRKAKGAEVWDLDGHCYLDMSIAGIGANVLGYADPDVDAAVIEAIRSGVSCSLNCPEEVRLADLLVELHPWSEMVRYARTGGEAMAIAVRLARATTGRDKIAFCGYHGWHDWYLAANLGTENALGGHLLPGLDPAGVPQGLSGTALPFAYNDIDSFQEVMDKHGHQLAAVITEPIRSVWPQDGYLREIKQLSHDHGALFIVDEISAGFRLNSGGAHLLFGLEPDAAVFSKAIGNGYAMSAIVGKRDIMETAQKTFISSTNWTERVGPSAALATIEKHRQLDVASHLRHIGGSIQRCWKQLADRHGLRLNVSGIEPLSHFSFEGDNAMALKALFVQEMLADGILASNLFYAMYAHTDDHVNRYYEAADRAFAVLSESVRSGTVNERLVGAPAVAGFKRLA